MTNSKCIQSGKYGFSLQADYELDDNGQEVILGYFIVDPGGNSIPAGASLDVALAEFHHAIAVYAQALEAIQNLASGNAHHDEADGPSMS